MDLLRGLAVLYMASLRVISYVSIHFSGLALSVIYLDTVIVLYLDLLRGLAGSYMDLRKV